MELLAELNKGSTVPGSRYSYFGTSAAYARDVVGNSYTNCWPATLDQSKVWRAYDQHPTHGTFRMKSERWMLLLFHDRLRVM